MTAELTRFADGCVGGALRFLLKRQEPAAAEDTCGLTVLAMASMGGHELNYSSDIDLVVFYDAAKFPARKKGDPARRRRGYRARAGQAAGRSHP